MALEKRLPHAYWAPHLFISALTGKGVQRILPMVDDIFESFNLRVSTSRLNKWLEYTLQGHSPPQHHHRPVRIYYVTQNRVRPPTFVFFSNNPEAIGKPYQRYLVNRLREGFELNGTPVKTIFRRRRKPGESSE